MTVTPSTQITVVERPYVCSATLFDYVADQDWAIYLDSGNLHGRVPRAESERYDVLVGEPIATLVTQGDKTVVEMSSGIQCEINDPLEVLQQTLAELLPTSEAKIGTGKDDVSGYLPGAYGYFSYDLARHFEELPTQSRDDEQLPEMAIGIYPVVVVIDHRDKKTRVIAHHTTSSSCSLSGRLFTDIVETLLARIDEIENRTVRAGGMPLQSSSLRENQTRDEYRRKFKRVRDYAIEGDCYQVNFSKRFSCQVAGSAWSSYRNLRQSSPAPYGAFMQLPFAEILSNSPESFIKCRARQVTTSPIQGTRPRNHNDAEEDNKIAQELLASAKDRAENLMIVDLMRNDLSRSCELGSVQVPKLFALHSFANVHHLISTVVGVLRKDLHALDLLRSCFPGGSITGAPKIRAMQIIEELEPDRRGLYCGSIGYVGSDGSLETNIAIRTIVIKDGTARFSAGGGLVIDSDPEDEYQELLDKAKMMKGVLQD